MWTWMVVEFEKLRSGEMPRPFFIEAEMNIAIKQ